MLRLPLHAACLLPSQYVNREEADRLAQLLRRLSRLEATEEEAERRLVQLLERFGIVPSGAVKSALMDWKKRGWQDLDTWKVKP